VSSPFSQPIRTLYQWLTPSPDESLEVRLFQQVSLASGLLSILVVLPLNLVQGFSPWVNIAVGLFGLLSIWLWLASRQGHQRPGILIGSYLLCLDVSWFANGGSIGSVGLFFFPAIMMVVIFLHGWKRTLAMLLYVADAMGILLVELWRPQWVIPFNNATQRLVDVMTGFLVNSGCCALAIWIVVDDFRRERRHLRRAMEQLERNTQDQLRSEAEKRELEIKVEHLQRIESLGRLAGGVAHDMNNVLAAIMSVGEVLRVQATKDSELSLSADRILQASRRGRNLVAGLLDFARKGLGDRVPIDINNLLRQEADLLASTTLRKIEVALDLNEYLPPVLGDPNAIANAVINLCVNASDAMPLGGTLTLRSRRENDRARISICDTGLGMEPEVLERAMEPFFSTKPQDKGTGLGLSIVLGIIEAHGGTMDIQSQPGKGTCVEFYLPLMETWSPPDSETPPTETTFVLQQILLVDDDEIVRETTAAMLEALGHHVIPCAGGRSALRRLKEGLEADLVILDMNMPGMGGEEVLRHLREIRPTQKVLIATGFTDADLKTLASHDPHLELITKPYSMDEIQRVLNQR